MMLYTVYKSDWECPEIIFHTCDKNKAEQFVKNFNELNYDKNNPDSMDKVYIRELNTDDIENEADKVINKYQKKIVTTINYHKLKPDYDINATKYQFINIDEVQDSAEIYDYQADFNQWNEAYIRLITDEFPNLEDENVQAHIKDLIDKEYKFQYELFND